MWFLVAGALVGLRKRRQLKSRHVRCTRCGRLVTRRPNLRQCPRCFEPLPFVPPRG